MTAFESRLTAERIASAVQDAGLSPLEPGIAEKFAQYYALLDQWNSKLNLTAIRNPEEVLRRHFVECIFCAQHLPSTIRTLLDYGSGAGFPGIPIFLCRPEIQVTLAESQGKKISFLREAVRSLGLTAEVYAGRVEAMSVERRFDAVTLRAVDRMQAAIKNAVHRVSATGSLAVLASAGTLEAPPGFSETVELAVPGLEHGVLILATRS